MGQATRTHLERWLETKFADYDIENKAAARGAIMALVKDDSTLLETKSWPEMLRMSDFTYKIPTGEACHTQEAIENALANGTLFVQSAYFTWHVREVSFDNSGNVTHFTTMFQPEGKRNKVELFEITNESFFSKDLK